MRAFGVIFRFVVAHPENFGRSETGERRICRDFNQAFFADFCRDFFAFLRCALVAPDNRRTDYFIVLVEHDKPVHLTGKSHALDVFRVDFRFGNHLLNCMQRSIIPVLRILFCPAVLRLVQRIFFAGGSHRLHGFIE